MLSCKDFLTALNDYLDETEDAELKREVEQHVTACPNCWVIFNTTQSTLKVFKGMEPRPIPNDLHNRLMGRLRQRMSDRGSPG